MLMLSFLDQLENQLISQLKLILIVPELYVELVFLCLDGGHLEFSLLSLMVNYALHVIYVLVLGV